MTGAFKCTACWVGWSRTFIKTAGYYRELGVDGGFGQESDHAKHQAINNVKKQMLVN